MVCPGSLTVNSKELINLSEVHGNDHGNPIATAMQLVSLHRGRGPHLATAMAPQDLLV